MLTQTSNVLDAELELRRRRKSNTTLVAPSYWQDWCRTLFPVYFSKSFAQRHIELWEWAESIEKGKRVPAFFAIWGRGGAKSTNAEAITIRLGCKNVRKYVWYVSSTQEKADAHVENIRSMLEQESFEKYYHKMSSRGVTKYGSSKGWRRERVHTASGFTVDSLGLDTGARGIKIEEARPDLIILDDIDELDDTVKTTLKKIGIITNTILPSGSSDCAVLFIQNLISPDSIASRLLDGRADFLTNRIVSGPHKAIDNLAVDQVRGKFIISGGTPTWDGQSLETCQSQIEDWGYTAFKREAQHDVDISGGMWDHIVWQHTNYDDLPDFIETVVWVDPAVTSTDSSDCQGISAGGKYIDPETKKQHMIGLYWWEGIDSPLSALCRAIRKAVEIKAKRVGVETDQGGDTWYAVFDAALKKVQDEMRAEEQARLRQTIEEDKEIEKALEEWFASVLWPKFDFDKAGAGYGSKIERNARMLTDYEHGLVSHMVGTHVAIEKSLRRFPGEPLDLADSWFWVWNALLGRKTVRMAVA